MINNKLSQPAGGTISYLCLGDERIQGEYSMQIYDLLVLAILRALSSVKVRYDSVFPHALTPKQQRKSEASLTISLPFFLVTPLCEAFLQLLCPVYPG